MARISMSVSTMRAYSCMACNHSQTSIEASSTLQTNETGNHAVFTVRNKWSSKQFHGRTACISLFSGNRYCFHAPFAYPKCMINRVRHRRSLPAQLPPRHRVYCSLVASPPSHRTGWLYPWRPHHTHPPSRSTHPRRRKDLRSHEPRDLGQPRPAKNSQLMPVWNFWPQILQDKSPRPSFLSNLTTTEFSWLQKRHENDVARGSR